jgi:hypothetical protein
MSTIDRRTVFGAAGAAMLAAACKPKDGERTQGQALDGPVKPFGPCSYYGQPTTDMKPNPAGNVAAFEPENICAVYIKFEPNGTLTVKQAQIAVPNATPTDADIAGSVQPLLQEMRKPTYTGNGAKKFRENFEDFDFSTQHVIAIYLDNRADAVRFSEKDGDVIRFAPISGNDPATKIRANHAFFDRRKIAIDPGSGTVGRVAYLLNFWNTNDAGDAIENVVEADVNTHHIYSMNIHLQMATAKRTAKLNWVPIVIDPDTGNMGKKP